MSDLSHIIAQETQDGRLIVRFLISAMNDQLPDFKPCHRLDAARLLVKLGFEPAQTFVDRTATQRSSDRRDRQAQPESLSAANRIHSELAQIVREETDHGRATVKFLISVMQGELQDFKPCHRLSAARELLHRGFDYVPEDEEPQEPVPVETVPAEPDPAEVEAQRRLAEDIEFSLHSPVYYQTYPYPCRCEDRLHDCKGNVLSEPEREKASRRSPGKQYIIHPNREGEFLARYADYQARRNAENPHNPIDLNLIKWNPKYDP